MISGGSAVDPCEGMGFRDCIALGCKWSGFLDNKCSSPGDDQFYKNEEDMDEEGDEDSAPLDLESDGEPNVSNKRSYLRTN